MDEIWNDAYSPWFPKGRNDPTVTLLEIVPTYAEYWDRSGVEAIRFKFAAAKSAVTGETLDEDVSKHGKVDFPSAGSTGKDSDRGSSST